MGRSEYFDAFDLSHIGKEGKGRRGKEVTQTIEKIRWRKEGEGGGGGGGGGMGKDEGEWKSEGPQPRGRKCRSVSENTRGRFEGL